MWTRTAASIVVAVALSGSCSADDAERRGAALAPEQVVGGDRAPADTTAGTLEADAVRAPASPGELASPEEADAPPSGAGTAAADADGVAASGGIPVGPGVNGVTDAGIRIGIITYDTGTTSTALTAVAGQEFPIEDPAKVARAVIEHVNGNGGIAGRAIEPVFHQVNAASYTQPSGRQQEQPQACARWTEDDPVFAFSAYGMAEDLALECAAATRTVMIATYWQANPSKEHFERMADVWYAPHGFVADRRERVVARGLVAQGFFGRDARVALMIEDKPDIRIGVERGLKPVLAAAGIEPELEVIYPDQIESPWQNYVLQMQTSGITHVVFSTTTGTVFPTLFAMRAAENQGYRPFWGIGSDNSPCGLTTLAPREQVVRTRGTGWQSPCDVLHAEPVSANDATCREIMRREGLIETAGRWTCEVLFFLRDAFAVASEISPSGLSAAMDELGTGYASTATTDGATRFSRSKHDGPATFRSFTFDERCGEEGASCFAYVGPVHTVED